ncbi:MAG: cupin domain-containing protein [Steroidobacteraceae bacterium]
MVTISHRIASLLVSGCLVAAASGVALGDDHPAYISKQDVSGEIFKKPFAKREPDGTGTALEAVTFDSKDKRFSSGMYQAGPEHENHMAGYEANEFVYLIKGTIKLTSADGTVIVVGPGEAATIPKGWKGHWDTDGYTKLWVTYDPDAEANAK